MKINRKWAMPSKNTFTIKPIKELIHKTIQDYSSTNNNPIIIDPFANNNTIATVTNDLDPQYNTNYHMDALDFLKLFEENSVDIVLYDPPYSPRQVSESYKKLNHSVNMTTTQASYWTKQKKEIARITKQGGVAICCGWNSGGIGKTNNFEMQEILLVPHGAQHNDTIITVETKKKNN